MKQQLLFYHTGDDLGSLLTYAHQLEGRQEALLARSTSLYISNEQVLEQKATPTDFLSADT